MKKIIIVFTVVLLTTVSGAFAAPVGTDEGDTQSYTAIVPGVAAIAEWAADFATNYKENGVYKAVADVFDAGRTPDEIVTNSLEVVEAINPQQLMAALYCAGAKHEDIRSASEDAGFSEMILVTGFETARTVCGDEITDTQAYTPIGPNFAGVPGGGDGGNTIGSPSSFTQ